MSQNNRRIVAVRVFFLFFFWLSNTRHHRHLYNNSTAHSLIVKTPLDDSTINNTIDYVPTLAASTIDLLFI